MSRTTFPPARLGQDPWSLVERQRESLRRFLDWAAQAESDPSISRRFEDRSDLDRVRSVLGSFQPPWWGLIVYTCFDSQIGVDAVKESFRRPLTAEEAASILGRTKFPKGSVFNHRRRPGVGGAKDALLSACRYQDKFCQVLLGADTFETRFEVLRGLRAKQWGRTTCYDLLARAGQLGIGRRAYRPANAHLYGSTGPKRGFEAVWRIPVTARNADRCEDLLRWWTTNWDAVCVRVAVSWPWKALDSADMENYLCIYNKSASALASQSGCTTSKAPRRPPLRRARSACA